MTFLSEPRRPMTMSEPTIPSRSPINLHQLQALNDEWGRLVRELGHQLELMTDTTPAGDLHSRIDRELLPNVEQAWGQKIEPYVNTLWGINQANPAQGRYSSRQFRSAVFLFANRRHS